MPGSEEFVQSAVHALEAGGLVVWVKRGAIALVIAAIIVLYLYQFRGLSTSQGMDQAQIGRAIASGEGWRTKLARPLAVGQLQAHGKDVARNIWFDTYNAPLPPLIDAIALVPVKGLWKLNTRSIVYAGDKAIATMSILLFIGSVAVLYFTARRLFDQRLALLVCGLVLLCDAMWEYSLSGLPQMLLLLLFNSTVYLLIRAVEAQHREESPLKWLVASGAAFGFLALTHALTFWMFLGALIFAAFFFRPRGWSALIMLAVYAIVYLPWLIRTWVVSGNPGGIAIYSIFNGVGHSEGAWMRRSNFDSSTAVLGAFRDKITTGLVFQTSHLFEYFGLSVVALMFFITLLYLLCAMPMVFSTPWLSPPKSLVRWPPYMPPLIGVLNDWMKPDEVTATDMPWAVAWYADRRSLWLPDTQQVFNELGDYKTLGGPVNGLYLTPVSGTDNKFRDIVKGEYRDWNLVIQRNQLLEKFPLKWNTVSLGLENECIFLSDHDREHPPAP